MEFPRWQLLSITHEIYKSFDYNLSVDIKGIFLNILKAFDKVWHDGLIFKLQTYDIDGELLKLLKSYLNDWQQRDLSNGQRSSWRNILAVVPARITFGTIIVPNIYTNDLPDKLTSFCKVFADDTTIWIQLIEKKIKTEPNKDLKMLFNPDPTKQATKVCFSHKCDNVLHKALTFNNNKIQSSPA